MFVFSSESDTCSKAVYAIIIMLVGHQQVLETETWIMNKGTVVTVVLINREDFLHEESLLAASFNSS